MRHYFAKAALTKAEPIRRVRPPKHYQPVYRHEGCGGALRSAEGTLTCEACGWQAEIGQREPQCGGRRRVGDGWETLRTWRP